MELIYNYITFNNSSGTLLVKTEIETTKNNYLKLEKILKRVGKNLFRAKSKIETLNYDDIIMQNFFDSENGKYSTINEFLLNIEGIEEDEDGYEGKNSENICYLNITNTKNKLNIKTQFEWPILYDDKNYSRVMKFIINFHKSCYKFDLTQEPNFVIDYNNIKVLYNTYLQKIGERFDEGKKRTLRAVK